MFFYDIAMKKCKNCGSNIPSDSSYCPKCGFKVEDAISLNDYASNDPYHSANEEEIVEAERVGVEEEERETKKETEKENAPSPSLDNGGLDHVFAILSLVFGALGGLLSIAFGVLVLTSKTASKEDKKKAYIGLGLCTAWFVLFFVLIAVFLFN